MSINLVQVASPLAAIKAQVEQCDRLVNDNGLTDGRLIHACEHNQDSLLTLTRCSQ